MRMRVGIIVFVVLVGCGSGKKTEPAQAGSAPIAATARAIAPKVTVASTIAPDGGRKPPLVLVVDDSGIRVTWASTWSELATKDLAKAVKAGSLKDIVEKIRAADYRDMPPEELVANWDKPMLAVEDDP